MEDDNDGGELLEEDYYACLNVARDASNEDITYAYRRLSRLYHPDKHIDPARKKEAEIMFNKTKKAYEVLRDGHKRAIYDSVGVRGLETDGWEVIQRMKTPQEIREEYERLARQREERRLQQRTNPKGSVTVNINATDIFNRYSYEYDDYDLDEGLPTIEISGMTLSQSIESPLTSRDTATISGYLTTHNGTGSGGINVSNKRALGEKAWLEFLVGAGQGPVFGVKGFRSLTTRIFATAQAHFHVTPGMLRTSLESTLGMQMDRDTMGYLSWRGGGMSSGMSTTVVKDSERFSGTVTVLLGMPHSFVALAYTAKLKEREMRLKLSVKVGTFGGMLEYSAEKKVSEQSTVSAAMSLGVPTGVVLKLKLTRASQTYLFPIQLSEEIMPSPVFYGTVAPLITWVIVKKFIIDPINAERSQRTRQRQKDIYRNRMAEKRREAEAAINLMSATFARVRSEEEGRRGLIIVSASYGRSSPVASYEESTPSLDVTIPLQCLVRDSKLMIHNASKSQLPGFYDPCPGEDKILTVQYLFHSQLHQTSVTDDEPLRIPRQSHRVNPT